MPKPLVIVESPAKAKTISKFLGERVRRARLGGPRRRPARSKGLAIDVDNGFKPTYELTERGKQVIKDLRAAMKDASELYLATDEDREGEAISWHLLEQLKPKVPVKRMVFHEITKAAIDHAVNNPRGIDYGLVDAAETRRILDRLYGYEVSPVLWRRVEPRSVGGPRAEPVDPPHRRARTRTHRVRHRRLLGHRAAHRHVAVVHRDARRARRTKVGDGQGLRRRRSRRRRKRRRRRRGPRPAALAEGLRPADVHRALGRGEAVPQSSPKAPFMTSTLQQEGGRKLRLSASQVMRVAQGLYERGYITYMRTDNVVLSATRRSRRCAPRCKRTYGDRFLSSTPRQYSSKVKNAQEAHEAIRPTTPLRSPDQLAGELNGQELSLYRHGLAAHPGVADGRRHRHHRVGASAASARRRRRRHRHASSPPAGTTITFPGYRQVYVESTDDGDATREAAERHCCRRSTVGDVVPIESLTPNGHTTSPPARYTEASIVKRLEELGHRPAVDMGDRSSRRSRTAATCGRRARRSCRRGPPSPSSA